MDIYLTFQIYFSSNSLITCMGREFIHIHNVKRVCYWFSHDICWKKHLIYNLSLVNFNERNQTYYQLFLVKVFQFILYLKINSLFGITFLLFLKLFLNTTINFLSFSWITVAWNIFIQIWILEYIFYSCYIIKKNLCFQQMLLIFIFIYFSV